MSIIIKKQTERERSFKRKKNKKQLRTLKQCNVKTIIPIDMLKKILFQNEGFKTYIKDTSLIETWKKVFLHRKIEKI